MDPAIAAQLPYFGYGTLLGHSHMRQRYPSARPVGRASYADHELGFWRYGDGIDGGGCTIVESPGRQLVGVLYRLDEEDTRKLLAVDGYASEYEVRQVEVACEDGRSVTAYTLRVGQNNGTWPPPDDYAGLVTAGAVEADLAADYRARLAEIIAVARSIVIEP